MSDVRHDDPADIAGLVVQLFAIDPLIAGGLQLHGGAGPGRDAVMNTLRRLCADGTPWVRMPATVTEDRLLGGMDIAATLGSGQVVHTRGVLAEADGGVLTLAMAERLGETAAAIVCGALDAGCVRAERDGLSLLEPTDFAVIALDESLGDDEQLAPALTDRLALYLDTNGLPPSLPLDMARARRRIAKARARVADVEVDEAAVTTLCAIACELGIDSMRTPAFAVRIARLHAALADRDRAVDDDLRMAINLVLAPRAQMLPPAPPAEDDDTPPPPDEQNERGDEGEASADRVPDDVLLEAALAAIPPHLLETLERGQSAARRGAGGRSGGKRRSTTRGRPIGTVRGALDRRLRLNVLATVRAAAPWQRLRGAERHRLAIRADDIRVNRYKQQTRATTVFVVDASGSSAVARLAEVKGAIELLLADCYVRRDEVAMIAFRGTEANLVLPPTRSLTRARRELQDLPGGGPTPLAHALLAGRDLAERIEAAGQRPLVVILTDGRGNVGLNGEPGDPDAQTNALDAARSLASSGVACLLIDTSRRPGARGRELAAALQSQYVPLPRADAGALSAAVKGAASA